jgi:hypothetical protein
VFNDLPSWYGEGEVKMYIDGDQGYPTICGTGLEDYVGTAWGLESHTANYQGAPIWVVEDPDAPRPLPDFVGFYRWHLPDPVVFRSDLKVTIQQIGAMGIPKGQEHIMDEVEAAGAGWMTADQFPEFADSPFAAMGLYERSDDYCATAFVYCQEPQAVPRLDVDAAIADIQRAPYEKPTPMEQMLQSAFGGDETDE